VIKEIRFPLPTIFERPVPRPFVFGQKGPRGKRRKPNLYDYIRFDRDPSFIHEFASLTKLPEDFAKDFLTVFFDELKHQLMLGNIVNFSRLGKFYMGGGNVDRNQKVKNEIDLRLSVKPRFKAAISLKKLLSKIYQ